MMPSASPFEGGVCCIKASPPSEPSVVSSATSIGAGWDCDDEYFSMCDDLLSSASAAAAVETATTTYSVSATMAPQLMQHHHHQQQQQQHSQQHLSLMHNQMQQQQQQSVDFMAHLILPHNNNNGNSINSVVAPVINTNTKTIPFLSERNASVDDSGSSNNSIGSCVWAKKCPIDWDENDTTDWLFDAAKEGEIPEEVILRSSYRPLTGADLAHMDLSDFVDKYGEYGPHFYRAFQQQVQLQGQQHLVQHHQQHQLQHLQQQSTISSNASDILGLQNPSGMSVNNGGSCWSMVHPPPPPPMETTCYGSGVADSSGVVIHQTATPTLLNNQQQQQLSMESAYSSGGDQQRQHQQQQQHSIVVMDYNNGYNSTAAAAAGYLNGHHQSGMTNHHLQHGGHHHHHQNHQNNNNNNKGYGGVGVGGDPLHLIQQQQQHESYDHYGDMLGGDHYDGHESYSNGTPSDPEEIMMPSEVMSSPNSVGGGGCGDVGGGGGGGRGGMKRVGRPSGSKANNRRRKPDRGYGKLWEFIRDLLHNPKHCPEMIRWENVDEGVFRIVQSEKLAALWGSIKNNPRMTYEKLSRAMRYYYKSKVFLPVLGRRLVYKFGPHAVLWKPENPNFERPIIHS